MSGLKEAAQKKIINPTIEVGKRTLKLGCVTLLIVGCLGLATLVTPVVFNPDFFQETPIPRTSIPSTPAPDQNISTTTGTLTTSDSDPSTPTATATETPSTGEFCVSSATGKPTRLPYQPLDGDGYECVIDPDGSSLGWQKIEK